jgi:hypothetical protein
MMTFCEALQIVTEHEQLLSEGPEDNIDFATKVHGGGGKTTKAAIARGDITRDQMAPMPGDKIGYHPIWNRERSEHLPSTEDQGSMELEPSIVGSDVPLQIYRMLDKRPQKYAPGSRMSVDQMINSLMADGIRATPQQISQALIILSNPKVMSTPLLNPNKTGNGWEVTIKQFQPNASQLGTPSDASTKIAMSPSEDQWAKPGEGGRMPGINTTNRQVSPEEAFQRDRQQSSQFGQAYKKELDATNISVANFPRYEPAANAYVNSLRKLMKTGARDPAFVQKVHARIQQVMTDYQKFKEAYAQRTQI